MTPQPNNLSFALRVGSWCGVVLHYFGITDIDYLVIVTSWLFLQPESLSVDVNERSNVSLLQVVTRYTLIVALQFPILWLNWLMVK